MFPFIKTRHTPKESKKMKTFNNQYCEVIANECAYHQSKQHRVYCKARKSYDIFAFKMMNCGYVYRLIESGFL